VTDQQRDVRPESSFFELCALCREIDGASTIWIDDDGRDPLHEDRLCLAQLGAGQTFTGV
jgi:hypothetical protein